MSIEATQHMMKRFLLIILCAALTGGCTPVLDHSTIKELAKDVRIADGVDRVEAILIAQDFIIRRSLYDRLVSLDPYRLERRSTWYRNGQPRVYAVLPRDQTGLELKKTWTLLFKDKRHTLLGIFPVSPFHVVIDEETGEVLNWGMKTMKFDPQDHTTIEYYE